MQAGNRGDIEKVFQKANYKKAKHRSEKRVLSFSPYTYGTIYIYINAGI